MTEAREERKDRWEDQDMIQRIDSAVNIGDYEAALELHMRLYGECFKIYEQAIRLKREMMESTSFLRNKAYYKFLRHADNHIRNLQEVLQMLDESESYILNKQSSRGGT